MLFFFVCAIVMYLSYIYIITRIRARLSISIWLEELHIHSDSILSSGTSSKYACVPNQWRSYELRGTRKNLDFFNQINIIVLFLNIHETEEALSHYLKL